MTSPSVNVTSGVPAWAAQGTEIPVQAESSVVMHSWEQSALNDADRFSADLHTLGLHDGDVSEGVTLAQSIESEALDAAKTFREREQLDGARQMDNRSYLTTFGDDLDTKTTRVYALARNNALTRLSNWLAGRRIVVDNRELVQVELSLFVLSTFNTAGCVSSYQATNNQSRRLGWSVTVFGTGLGGEATVSSSVTSTLTADAGQACLIFLPVTVAVEQVRVLAKDGTTIGSGQRVDVSPAKAQSPVPGARLLDANVLPAAGASVQTYPLAGYAASTPAEYQYIYTQEKAVSVQAGAKAFGSNVTVSGSVTMSKSVTLDFRLAGGRDYRLCKLAGGDVDGLVWG